MSAPKNNNSTLRIEERENYAIQFVRLTGGKGWMSREQFGGWLSSVGFKHSDHQRERIFRSVDANEDGRISLDEFFSAMEIIKEPPRPSKMSNIFQKLDKNGDGVLSEDEIHEGLNGCGYNFTKEQISKLVKSMDQNGDGKISFEEFCNYFE